MLFQRSVQCRRFLSIWLDGLSASGKSVVLVDPGGLVSAVHSIDDSSDDLDTKALDIITGVLTTAGVLTSQQQVLVICGFSGLLSRIGSCEAENLKKFLRQLNSASNLFVVLVDTADAAGSYVRQPWFTEQTSTREALWIGDGIASQGSLTLNYVSNLEPKVGDGMGYSVESGVPRLVRLINQE